MAVDDGHLRVSDQERQAAVDRLKAALDEGRLDLLEYDRRIGLAYQSVTYGDLDQLFTDLPRSDGLVVRPPSGARPAVRPARRVDVGGPPLALKVLWTIWGAVLAINVTVWLLVSLSNDEPVYFWPMWLLVPGLLLGGTTVGVQALRRGMATRRELG